MLLEVVGRWTRLFSGENNLAIWHHIRSVDGIDVPLMAISGAPMTRSVFLLLPALGIRAKFYTKLAEGLAEQGISTVVVEQRGNGESPYRPGDGSTFGLQDYLDTDIAVATKWAQNEFPSVPITIGGHSLGGHMAALAGVLRPTDYNGIARLACGFPYYKDFPRPASVFIKLMIWTIPMLTRLVGYFPGNRLGFGGKEYRGLMMDWRLWAKSGRYENHIFPDSESAMTAYSKRVISLGFEQDTLAPDAAISRSLGMFKNANITQLKLGSAEQGDYLGHINWGKKPDGVVLALTDWFNADLD